MDVNILNIKPVTKKMVNKKLSEYNNLSKNEIDECLDILSAINKNQFVYIIDTPNGDFVLYITAKPCNVKF